MNGHSKRASEVLFSDERRCFKHDYINQEFLILESNDTKTELFGQKPHVLYLANTRHCLLPNECHSYCEAWWWQHHAIGFMSVEG